MTTRQLTRGSDRPASRSATPPSGRLGARHGENRSLLLPTGQEALLAVFVAIAAIDQTRFDNPISLRVLSVAITIALLGSLVSAYFRGVLTRPNLYSSPQLGLLVSWVLWSAISALGENWQHSLSTAGGFALVLGSTYAIVRSGGRIAATRTIWLGFSAHLLIGTFLVKTSTTTPFVEDHLALASLEANQLARVAALGCIGSLWLAREYFGLQRLVVAGSSVLGLAIVLVTMSRTGAFGLAVALTILVLHVSRRRIAGLALGLLLLLIALALAGAIDVGDSTRFSQVTSFSEGEVQSFSGRSTLWPQIIDEISNSPIIGIGLGNDRSVVAELPIGWGAQHTHSLVLHLALTTGVIGAGILLGAIALSLVRSASQTEPLAMALLTFILIDGISEAVLRVPAFGWLAICVAVLLTSPTVGTKPILRDQLDEIDLRSSEEGPSGSADVGRGVINL